ncbi:hypothetical protein SAY87_019154 [Trapa incisa]|uniref:Uncharacterized protein n=1 Tax=Trapa incisa TaxID=236973 RepID=A0AAN7K5A1_9MYRT|nr:hypothetical protein SAY87_019154 [Trapa incisa]
MDCDTIFAQIKHEDKQLCLKRRWLMGLQLSRREQECIEGPEFLKKKTLPESLLREDDIFFETAKCRVEEAFGVPSNKIECSVVAENFIPFDVPRTIRQLRSRINDLTTRGLYHLTVIVTGGSIKYMKTRQSMRKVVKEYLPKVLHDHRNKHCICEMCKQLYLLLSDPRNFRRSDPLFLAQERQSEKAIVIKLLEELDGFPLEFLNAMKSLLKGKRVNAPSRRGRSRDYLVRTVKKIIMKMLSKLGDWDALQEPLAKTMTLAILVLKLTFGPQYFYLRGFYEISPQVEALQNDIVMALWLLRARAFSSYELDKLRGIFNLKMSGYIKPVVKKILVEYLCVTFEADAIPKSILDGLAFINSKFQTTGFSKVELEEELECIMDLSAQTKQLAWDLFPENAYHKGFADAYLEELQESDDDDLSDEDEIKNLPLSWKVDGLEADLVEGFGESVAASFGQSTFSGSGKFSSVVMSGKFVIPKVEDEIDALADKKQCASMQLPQRNQYISIQDVCDETSLVAYNLVGLMLEKFAGTKGLELGAREQIYLKGRYFAEEDHSAARKKITNSLVDLKGSDIHQAIRMLIPSLQKSRE